MIMMMTWNWNGGILRRPGQGARISGLNQQTTQRKKKPARAGKGRNRGVVPVMFQIAERRRRKTVHRLKYSEKLSVSGSEVSFRPRLVTVNIIFIPYVLAVSTTPPARPVCLPATQCHISRKSNNNFVALFFQVGEHTRGRAFYYVFIQKELLWLSKRDARRIDCGRML